MATEDKTTDKKDEEGFQKGVPLLPRAPGSLNAAAVKGDATKSAEDSKPKPGMPEGYEPDTSAQYVKGKAEDGSDDQVKVNGKAQAVSPDNQNRRNAMEELPVGHTYRDRVEAQARSLGIEVIPEETLELLMFKIRMMASS